MSLISGSLARSLCFSLALLLCSTFVFASDQMPRCSEIQYWSAWDYCVDNRPTNRSWYQAMADCRNFDGELVSLESRDIEDMQERVRELGVNLTNGIFVNAHLPFYSANDRFAWSNGIELPLEKLPYLMEQCVKYSLNTFQPIACDKSNETFPLLCERVFQPKFILDPRKMYKHLLTLPLYKHVFKSINYSAESCDYYSFKKFEYNWYEVKKLCGTFNAELLGIPRSEECQLVDEFFTNNDYGQAPQVFLNIHLKMYARNGSSEIFLDPSGKTIHESNCSWKEDHNIRANRVEDGRDCIIVVQGKTILPFNCHENFRNKLKGFICKQCRPNNYSYLRKSESMRCLETTSIQSLGYICQSGVSTPVTISIISACVMIIVVLLVALVLSVLRNRRTRDNVNGVEAACNTVTKSNTNEEIELVPSPDQLPTPCTRPAPEGTSISSANYCQDTRNKGLPWPPTIGGLPYRYN